MHAHTTTRRLVLWLATTLALLGCAGAAVTPIGDPGELRTIEVRMVDTAFEPTSITVEDGETVRLRFSNDGQLPHDAFIGDEAAQARHGEEMAEDAHGGHGPEDLDAITVESGGTGELVHTFTPGDTIRIGCHQPGHYEAGMVLDVTVS